MTDTRQFRKLQQASSAETSVLWTDAPAIAASDTDMVNNTATTKWVRITGGTVSALKTGLPGGGTAITSSALASGASEWVPVRPGHALRIVYSVVPTSVQWFES